MQATRALLKRSVWKGTHRNLPKIAKKVNSIADYNRTGPHLVPLPIVFPKKQGDKVPPVRTQARSATILPNFVGLKFEIHNGKDYHQVTITEDMVGHKLGEFSPYVCASLR
ncbi:ribosomal protein S19 [Metarhizium acridum CQMa 102]|uniref:Ribosomal protein S19 n=1 Tax=Metarhizium acridum (strain CQMa 102) TaxID=655827 RepID=E9DX68_METAQ|nr:ribosomal protein S19 [Metarhizium acridum CQMa 102]EFY91626.1 ribosomal protein S19 [Metarhizium acridum CQMa 102]